jgi:hypothetical protein
MSVYGGPKNSAWIFLNTNLEPQAILDEFENYYIETSNVQKVKIEPRNIPDFISNKKHTIVKKKHVLVFLKVT